ncbi:MAG: thymidine kinase [Planctomycetes bacterium]|nr:thymidine kinase [Planctomycetota bacterium]
MHQFPRGTGWIEVICGSMFAGKTQELIRRLRLAAIAKQKVQVFKHAFDSRYARDHVVSHDLVKIPSRSIRKPEDVLRLTKPDTDVVGIDEAHFFEPDIVRICEQVADSGRRVIVAGLDQDYRGTPFEPMARLMAVAEYVTKNLAICVICGNPANRNQRVTRGKKRIDVGSTDKYEARCRRCFKPT